MKIISLVLFIATFVGFALAGEWNCADTSGVFERSTNCAMGEEVAVSGDLTVTGKETVYSMLTAASGRRHFKIDSGAHRVSLSWLNLTGGNVGSSNGGSIYVKDVSAHLNISHCVFFKNSARQGGAIWAYKGQPNLFFHFVVFNDNNADGTNGFGGAVYLEFAKLVDHSSIYTTNTAGAAGGGISLVCSNYSSFDITVLNNTAGRQGGGIYIYGYSFGASFVNLLSAKIQNNKQIWQETNSMSVMYGGGGLYLDKNVIVNIRECTFIRNEATQGSTTKHGHHIFTYKETVVGTFIPSFAVVNTNFTDVSGSHPFYGINGDDGTHGADKYVSPTTCAFNTCSVSPFTGTCTARTDTKAGVLCGVTECPTGDFRNAQVTESILPPPNPPSCSAWTSCTVGEYVSSNGTNTTDRVCTPCGAGAYSASANKDSCTLWTNCTTGQHISTNGTSTADRVCTPCGTGTYSTSANAFSCTAWSDCVAGQKIAANGTSSTDRTCEACSTGKFSTATNQNTCTNWTTCSTGQYIATNGTSSADRACSPCGAGKYSTSANAFSCTAWTNCVAGQKIAANGTATTDRTCVACSTGKFSTATNLNTCTNWTTCNATTEVESSAGSVTADRVCAAAESPSPSDNSPSPAGSSPSPADSPSPAESSPSPAANGLTIANELSTANRYRTDLSVLMVWLIMWFGL